jgi:hypothetical protein
MEINTKTIERNNYIFICLVKKWNRARRWWRTPLIPALGRQRQADFWVRGQPGLQSEFQDSQDYTEKPCLEKPKKKKKKKKNLPWGQTSATIRFFLLVVLDIQYYGVLSINYSCSTEIGICMIWVAIPRPQQSLTYKPLACRRCT